MISTATRSFPCPVTAMHGSSGSTLRTSRISSSPFMSGSWKSTSAAAGAAARTAANASAPVRATTGSHPSWRTVSASSWAMSGVVVDDEHPHRRDRFGGSQRLHGAREYSAAAARVLSVGRPGRPGDQPSSPTRSTKTQPPSSSREVAALPPGEPHEALDPALAHRDHEAPAGRQLFAQRAGHVRGARGDDDRVEGGVVGPAERAVAVAQDDPVVAEDVQQLRARGGRAARCAPPRRPGPRSRASTAVW